MNLTLLVIFQTTEHSQAREKHTNGTKHYPNLCITKYKLMLMLNFFALASPPPHTLLASFAHHLACLVGVNPKLGYHLVISWCRVPGVRGVASRKNPSTLATNSQSQHAVLERLQFSGVQGLAHALGMQHNIGALVIRTGFWGSLYYTHKKEPPKQYW